ncbi:MAG: glycerophosphodiester phosphodiesterase family protein [Clostridia bacterium]|nr:glycerophosphodiester phosphodiesterase family protein [Clostridia bacterium]
MKQILIAAHRGLRGGNLVENTLPAFRAALRSGADILEMDLKRTQDGVLVLFHDLDVHRLLPTLHGPVRAHTLRELRCFSLNNQIGEPSGCAVATLEEALSAFRNRCLINLDQADGFIEEAWPLVTRQGMADQVVFKGAPPFDGALVRLARCDWQPLFMPILRTDADIAAFRALPGQVRIPMVEVMFQREDAAVLAPAFRQELARQDIRVWVNALDLGKYPPDMCALHNDTVSMLHGPENGWGWLIDHGADVIQTDFPRELRDYLGAKN